MTHIHIRDLKEDDTDTLEIDDLPCAVKEYESEVKEHGTVAVGSSVFVYGWGDECPAHDSGIHYGKGRCRKCGQTE